MKTIFDGPSRSDILARIHRVSTEMKPRWGKMNAEGMLTHLVQSARMATGELVCTPRKLPIRYFPLKQLIIYLLPFPKGAPTARELVPSDSGTLERSKDDLSRLVEAVAAKADDWPEHPAFGRLTRRGWGVLTYRHFDHHLRQFGV